MFRNFVVLLGFRSSSTFQVLIIKCLPHISLLIYFLVVVYVDVFM